jgi:hypothetical protein
MAFIKFPKIGQFRDVITHVRKQAQFVGIDAEGNVIVDRTRKAPTLKFKGTVKLHGTNAAVVRNADGTIHFQSRERIITPTSDNAGFAIWASTVDWNFFFFSLFNPDSEVAIFGEWCGGNIQQGIALNQLTKRFVIFKVMVDGVWQKFTLDVAQDFGIYNINSFPSFEAEIDFENPGVVQNILIAITEQVEAECPVGKAFGVTGIGEGVVWTCESDPTLVFKVKGEKHSASKVKVLASVDTEKAASLQEFVENSVTENRLNQGLENIDELDVKCTGQFLKWVVNDVLVEEADVIVASLLETKEVNREVSKAAKVWFMEKLKNA